MIDGLTGTKQFFGGKILTRFLTYLRRDPANNLSRILYWVTKAPVMPQHRQYAEEIRTAFESNPAIRKYIVRIFDQTSPNVQEKLLINFFINAGLVGTPKQYRLAKKCNHSIPFTILIDPTSGCNLNCRGCWAGRYETKDSLTFDEVDRIIEEAKELGIYFFVMSGGEPLLWPHLFELAEKHDDCSFMLYTNGTLIDKETAQKMCKAGNISPAISLEGDEESTDYRRGEGVFAAIEKAMGYLREEGVLFGCSLTATSKNFEEIQSESFIDRLIELGVIYGWIFHYIPIGSSPDFSLMLTPDQRARLYRRIKEIRVTKPIQLIDFWNDGELTGGCIAGGKRYFHITARGDVEPCAFVHFAVDNIKNKSLKEVLDSPLFRSYQRHQPFSKNLLRPCPLIDTPRKLRKMIRNTKAEPTHPGADAVLKKDQAERFDHRAAEWKQHADQLWARYGSENKKEENRRATG